MQTEHRQLCVYRCVQKRQFSLHKLLVSVNTVYETVLCPLHANSQHQGSAGQPMNDYSHHRVRSSHSLIRVYACYEIKTSMLLRYAGLLLVLLTFEMSQEKF